MCHAWEYELIRKAYAEEMERRRKEEEAARAEKPASAPPRPYDPQPQVRIEPPIPA